jgi:two-component system cell cycle sensor histidine kinase/response regulator CckA
LKVQAELRLETQKLEALGRMGRAVAHDLNNLLMVVLSTAEEARESNCPHCNSHAQTLLKAGEVGQRLVRRLFELGGRDGLGELSPLDVGAVLQGLGAPLRSLAGLSIDLSLEVRSDARVRIPQAELEQLILNLVVNARDAINGADKSGGGQLTVSLRDPTLDDDLPPDRVVLEVSDTGAGMDERTRAHLFEPYFTTKPDGSGLGLAIVYGIVKRAGGAVDVASAPDAGSTFRVSLPRELPPRRGA